ncbi:hypothetical protein [Streptomyces sp. NPDC005303]|uniref:hypothetical protein n=1 Tax=Streptomyces sp. NPDC005303 TaxID=3155713 RepID=UPI0033A7B591
MTHPPKSSAAPPVSGVPTIPAVPPQPGPPVPAPQAPPSAPAPDPAPARRTAFAEGFDQVRAAATTEPGRLRIIGAAIALLVLLFGAVTAWQTDDRATAADDVLHKSQPLSSAAADIYLYLADANTTASSGFLAGGQESADSRERYERDIDQAADGLVEAASNSEPNSPAAKTVAELNTLLPEYKGLVEQARTYNRQGFPVGGAYLRYANEKMQEEMLPKAQNLYTSENQRLRADYAEATPYPWAAIGLGVLALAGLAWAQHRNYRRTNRVLNHGLVAATATATVVLLWLVVGHTVARSGLEDSYDHGVRSLNVLHDARIASLKARGNENLTLVARGAETVTKKNAQGKEFTYDAYDLDFGEDMDALGKGLAEASKLADDRSGEEPVTAAQGNMKVWKERHAAARTQDDYGNYEEALKRVIGGKGATGECFDSVDHNLDVALKHEKSEFQQSAGDGLDAMTGLTAGAAVLAVLGAAGAVLGIGRRLSEYR